MTFQEKHKSALVLFIKPELKAKFGMLQQSRKFSNEEAPVFIQLLTIEDTLERHYKTVKAMQTGSKLELALLKEIKMLEDKRFNLLDKINGQQISDYAQ